MTTAMKGVSLKPVDFGLAFAKQGYQVGVTGTIPNVAAPSVTNTKFRVGFGGCPHFNVCVYPNRQDTFIFKCLFSIPI